MRYQYYVPIHSRRFHEKRVSILAKARNLAVDDALDMGKNGVYRFAGFTMDAEIAAKRDAENQGSRNRQSRREDKAYDVIGHGANPRKIDVTPHAARNNGPAKTGKARPTIGGDETAASDACGMPQTRRKVIEWILMAA